jgi:hypothetical protein
MVYSYYPISEEPKMALVYRVEDRKCIGPYRGQYYDIFMSHVKNRHTNDYPPVPYYDNNINRFIKDSEKCGFKDLQQFRKWFNLRDRRLLHSLGFVLAVYEAKEIEYGKYQVLFDKENVCKIQEYSLLTKKRY